MHQLETMSIDSIKTLAEAGMAGISLALIVALVVIVKSVLKMVQNHLAHNTASTERLANKIEQFIDIVKDKL